MATAESFAAAFAPAEAAYKSAVMHSTWGHLVPEVRNRKEPGYMVFSCAGYGGTFVLIDAKFKNVGDSPWLYDAMYDYVCRHANKRNQRGKVLRFDGTVEFLKNGRFRLSGKSRVVNTGAKSVRVLARPGALTDQQRAAK